MQSENAREPAFVGVIGRRVFMPSADSGRHTACFPARGNPIQTASQTGHTLHLRLSERAERFGL